MTAHKRAWLPTRAMRDDPPVLAATVGDLVRLTISECSALGRGRLGWDDEVEVVARLGAGVLAVTVTHEGDCTI